MPPSIRIDIAAQRLTFRDGERQLHFPISSGRNGIGFREGSGCTPTGRFRIVSKHGEHAPLLTIFRARLPVGLWPEASGGQDDVLTRILCLDGLDPQNANTLSRYIYIHGTIHTEQLGTPASHGCIRLAPEAMSRLFDLTPLGTPVTII